MFVPCNFETSTSNKKYICWHYCSCKLTIYTTHEKKHNVFISQVYICKCTSKTWLPTTHSLTHFSRNYFEWWQVLLIRWLVWSLVSSSIVATTQEDQGWMIVFFVCVCLKSWRNMMARDEEFTGFNHIRISEHNLNGNPFYLAPFQVIM